MDIKKPLVNYSGVIGELLADDVHINKGSHYLVFNNTGSTIAAGTLVMATGTTGSSGQITIAAWNGTAPSKYIMGLVLADIPDDTEGVCVEFGPLRGIQTDGGNYSETWADGEILFAGTSGGLTKVQPEAPSTKTTIAIVISSHASNGTLLVRTTFGSNLGEDELIELSTLNNKDLLAYNSTHSRFENQALIGAANGIASLDANTLVPKAELGAGDADNTKFLRGDGIWAVPTSGGGLGSIPFYNADTTQDDIDIVAATELTSITVTSQVNMTSNTDLRVADGFGWRDIMGQITPRGQNAPSWTTYRDGIYLYACPNNQSKEWFLQFHIDHDYAIGTKVYPHIHFTVNTVASGTVRFGIEYTVAKGHQQASGSVYGASTTIYVEQAITTADQYKHFVLETGDADAIPSTLMEPDAVILMRMFTDTTHANYTWGDDVFLIQADCHYQASKFATLNKTPDFYA